MTTIDRFSLQCNRGAMALRGRGVSGIPTNAQGSAAYRRLMASKTKVTAKVYKMQDYTTKGVINVKEAA